MKHFPKSIALKWVGGIDGFIKILDQTALPNRVHYINCRSIETLCEAIKNLRIRGAPLIGIASAYGIVLSAKKSCPVRNSLGRKSIVNLREKFMPNFITSYYFGIPNILFGTIPSISNGARLSKIYDSAEEILSTRPTAVNLSWAIKRMLNIVEKNRSTSFSELRRILLREARQIHKEDAEMCYKIGLYGNKLIKKNAHILTICNTGEFATGGQGTAFSVIFTAYKSGKNPTVYACETRPLLQGARLTMWELKKAGIKSYLICDFASATVIKNKNIDCIITGADRITANGDTANKIGTYGLAILAKAHSIPFYVAAPSSTFDLTKASGDEIPIEERSHFEITHPRGIILAPDTSPPQGAWFSNRVNAYNPAFDITPSEYITAFITEKGIIKPPFKLKQKLKI